jgi:hypothetical protein
LNTANDGKRKKYVKGMYIKCLTLWSWALLKVLCTKYLTLLLRIQASYTDGKMYAAASNSHRLHDVCCHPSFPLTAWRAAASHFHQQHDLCCHLSSPPTAWHMLPPLIATDSMTYAATSHRHRQHDICCCLSFPLFHHSLVVFIFDKWLIDRSETKWRMSRYDKQTNLWHCPPVDRTRSNKKHQLNPIPQLHQMTLLSNNNPQ